MRIINLREPEVDAGIKRNQEGLIDLPNSVYLLTREAREDINKTLAINSVGKNLFDDDLSQGRLLPKD